MENISALNAFVDTAEARSFTVAGRQLNLSPSAVAKAIRRLEDQVGVRLFHRSTRTMTLTPEGSLFLERCRRILCEVEAARAELAHSRGEPRGRLRVSLPVINSVSVPVLDAFVRAYPEVQLDLEFSDRLVDVIEEGFDAVVRAGDNPDSRLMSRVLGEFRLKLVASPQYLARRPAPQLPEDLRHHACLVHRFVTSGRYEAWPIRPSARELDPAPPAAIVANTIEPLLMMVERGLGIACLPDLLVGDQIADGRLVTVLDEHVHHVGTLRLLWPSSRHLSPKLRVFIDFMGERFLRPVQRPGPSSG